MNITALILKKISRLRRQSDDAILQGRHGMGLRIMRAIGSTQTGGVCKFSGPVVQEVDSAININEVTPYQGADTVFH